jgi:CheY-like chemotaxis protein
MSAPRILLVDDRQEVIQLIRSSLESFGRDYVVVDVTSGEDAVLELGRAPVDLLVVNFPMLGPAGFNLLEKVRLHNPNASVIFIGGHLSAEMHKKAEALGVVAFLAKPVEGDIFIEAVDHALRHKITETSPVVVQEGEKPPLIERLDGVRRDLGALATLLIDNRGNTVVHAGEVYDLDLEAAMPSLVTTLNAGYKVSSLMGSLLPGNFQYFDGDTHKLYLTNVGAFYALLIVFREGQEGGQMGAVVHFGRRAAEDLIDLLSESEITTELGDLLEPDQLSHRQPRQWAKWVAINGMDDELESELENAAKDVEREDAEQFWDDVVSDSPVLKETDEGMLTFKEARDLGLLDEESDSEKVEDEGG